jgi:hypothetical protein
LLQNSLRSVLRFTEVVILSIILKRISEAVQA